MLPPDLPHYPAPAKLNLDLRITGRRDDGYHLLESVFVLIGWQDTLCITPRDDGAVLLHTPTVGVPPDQDLCVRAAQALQRFSGSLKGVDIWLDKQLPMGGGLGGGSSDAATVLMTLNHLWSLDFSTQQLIDIGVTLGADVPFFVFGESAFARGIGEKLQPFAVPEQWFVIIKPDAHVATPEIFTHPDLPRNSQGCLKPDYHALQPFRNDMQALVLREYPAVATVFRVLFEFGSPRLTGSGACLFLDGLSRDAAEYIIGRLPENLHAHAAPLLPEHPLRRMLCK